MAKLDSLRNLSRKLYTKKAPLSGADYEVIYDVGHVKVDARPPLPYESRSSVRGSKKGIANDAKREGAYKKSYKPSMESHSDGFVKWTPSHHEIDSRGNLVRKGGHLRFTKKGIAIVGSLGIAGSSLTATSDYIEGHVGMIDNEVTSPTPSLVSNHFEEEMAGATGDLVFALHHNR